MVSVSIESRFKRAIETASSDIDLMACNQCKRFRSVCNSSKLQPPRRLQIRQATTNQPNNTAD